MRQQELFSAYNRARFIHSVICCAWLRPFASQSLRNFSACSGSSRTVTASRGSERGLRPAPLRFPPWLMIRRRCGKARSCMLFPVLQEPS